MNKYPKNNYNAGAMNSFKEKFGWEEPYESAKKDFSIFNESLIGEFEKSKDGSGNLDKDVGASLVFKEWFKLTETVFGATPLNDKRKVETLLYSSSVGMTPS